MIDPLPAGDFSAWLRAMREALAGRTGMQVACGDCVGCCTSYYYIKVRAREAEVLKRIPPEHLEAEAGNTGTWLMAPDAKGHCPMYGATGCSIYSHRPDTCRTYDCRIFAAAGMNAGDGRPVINERVARWRFEFTDAGHVEKRAVTAAASFLRQHPVRFPGGHIPSRPTDIAVLAVKSYTVFMQGPVSDTDAAAGIVEACRSFDQASI